MRDFSSCSNSDDFDVQQPPFVGGCFCPGATVDSRAANPEQQMSPQGRQRQSVPMSNGHLDVFRERLAPGFVERLLPRSRLRGPAIVNVSCTLGPVVADVNFAALERPGV